MSAPAPPSHLPDRKENASGDIILHAEQITKVFPGTLALDKVDFEVYRGKVNGLIGENGAGKSTLMKILAGVEPPTSGRLLLEGKEVTFKSTRDAARAGIGIIYQELNLCPNLSIAENIFMAREMTQGGVVCHRAQELVTEKILRRLEQPLKPRVLVSELRMGQQQIVEIAKALAQDVRILIMDEPTSALTAAETESLFRMIADLKASGVTIVYISHKLEELLRIGDQLTVLRDGKLAAHAPANSVTISWIIENMVGRKIGAFGRRRSALPPVSRNSAETLLKIENLTLPRVSGGYTLQNVSLSLFAGEIVAIYGLMGAGRTELFECLIGLHAEATGSITLCGQPIKRQSIAERIALGIMLVPEDRQRLGLVQTMSVARNITLASLQRCLNTFVLSERKERDNTASMMKDLSIKAPSPSYPVTSLSGGNQQKVVLGKSLLTQPRVLLLDEPTRGIDVGAKAEIFEIMNRLAEQGLGILFVSSELPEMLSVPDRIIVLSKGNIAAEFTHANASEERLVLASAAGQTPASSREPPARKRSKVES